MTTQEQIEALRKRIAEIERQEERRKTMLEMAMTKLKELGHDTVESAQAEIVKLGEQMAESERRIQGYIANVKRELEQ
jgi:predicted  nucleic acid-binding Zn-ribbon protein